MKANKLFLIAVDDKQRTMTLGYDPPTGKRLKKLQVRELRLGRRSKKPARRST